MTITYLYNSGFTVKENGRLLVFDPVGGLAAPERSEQAVVFVSHAHGDHFDPIVDTWRAEGRVSLVTGFDIPSGGISMRPGDRIKLDGLTIEAFGSTDEGVSFLVNANGKRIYHAGDFNLWHWRGESTAAEIKEATDAFERVLDTLKGQKIDVAFFPVDPRLGSGYEEGAWIFVESICPSLIIPMHFREDAKAALDFAAAVNTRNGKTRAKALTKPGETYTL